MLGINSNINSLVAQQNLNGSQSALSQAITRLSSGKRINSAADDAAGLAISTGMQTQINGLNQGVSNANNGVSMIQTASSGLAQITSSLQRIRQLAVQASSGGLTADNQAALQQEVAQQISEVNRIASQTQFNGQNILDGSAGSVSFQVGANVGQTVSLNLTQSLSSSSLGGGKVQAGATLGSIGVSVDSAGAAWVNGTSTGNEITQINVLSNGNGGYTFTDQNNQTLSTAAGGAVQTLFGTTPTVGTLTATTTGALNPATELTAINTNNAAGVTAGTVLGTIGGISVNAATGANIAGASPANAITSITAKSDGSGNVVFFDQNGSQLSSAATTAIFGTSGNKGTAATATVAFTGAPTSNFGTISANNAPPTVSNINISTTSGANQAMEAIDNALTTVNNIQATLGAAQNRFTAISTTQQAQSTDLAGAQSQIQDANFAQETANLSKAQVLQQAGISVLAQANSLPQQVLKLLQ
ncbi:flagellin N-terminal helical domain-containing protein [Paraburkholderia haematera]|uniref:Flagellin n=1 Tax=Paraburkholderia haematera TaxID=2793077 RepID=A0ABM8RU59_9BURK|nr:flagellin [Paraburkholderia haematera]CAE6771580.1 Flagellin [Paraburkholderia haematera]